MADNDKLARLMYVRQAQKKLKDEAERLKDELLADGIEGEGQVWFIGHDGEKHRAHHSPSTSLAVDLPLLRTLVPPEVVDRILAPPRVVPDAFMDAKEAGDIPNSVVARVARMVTKSQTIRFDQGED